MILQRLDGDPEWPGVGRKVTDLADIELLSSWLQNCEDCTKDTVDDSLKLPSTFRLIDVEEQCLVTAPKRPEYAILSYVWGRLERNYLRTLQGNLYSLEEKGGLVTSNTSLPKTISDAMILVRALGQRYLWVDSICIVQDDDKDKLAQISSMTAIYSLASFTIVAAIGQDADAGLPGSPVTPRAIKQASADIQGMTIVNRFPDINHALDAAFWNTRAWTFQERVLSERLLVFGPRQVYYRCRHKRLREDSVESPVEDGQRPDSHQIDGPESSWVQYALAVTNYSTRNLSFQSDGLRAFSGIIGYFQSRCKVEFTFGLPIICLDLALLWHARRPLRRRENEPGLPPFPSYSWVGWIGPVGFDASYPLVSRVSWRNHVTMSEDSTDIEGGGVDASRKRAVEEGLQEIGRYWNHPRLYDDRSPKMPSQLWKFMHASPTGHLEFMAQTAFFRLSEIQLTYPYIITDLSVGGDLDPLDSSQKAILSADGAVVGALHLDSPAQVDALITDMPFILLSRTCHRRDATASPPIAQNTMEESEDIELCDQLQFEADSKDRLDDWNLYNVMLVDTFEGVSQRLGIGVMMRKEFLKANPKGQLITLG
jgi:hypothetical protein